MIVVVVAMAAAVDVGKRLNDEAEVQELRDKVGGEYELPHTKLKSLEEIISSWVTAPSCSCTAHVPSTDPSEGLPSVDIGRVRRS